MTILIRLCEAQRRLHNNEMGTLLDYWQKWKLRSAAHHLDGYGLERYWTHRQNMGRVISRSKHL